MLKHTHTEENVTNSEGKAVKRNYFWVGPDTVLRKISKAIINMFKELKKNMMTMTENLNTDISSVQ